MAAKRVRGGMTPSQIQKIARSPCSQKRIPSISLHGPCRCAQPSAAGRERRERGGGGGAPGYAERGPRRADVHRPLQTQAPPDCQHGGQRNSRALELGGAGGGSAPDRGTAQAAAATRRQLSGQRRRRGASSAAERAGTGERGGRGTHRPHEHRRVVVEQQQRDEQQRRAVHSADTAPDLSTPGEGAPDKPQRGRAAFGAAMRGGRASNRGRTQPRRLRRSAAPVQRRREGRERLTAWAG